MTADRYTDYYAAKLWQLIPTVYRAMDGTPVPTDGTPPSAGPLREIVNRIGAEAAVIRRSIDRLWEDQSIESCDDWLIPYIGDLLATRLVAGMDARAQRLDVANTIYYRRRKGTVGLLEQLASDLAARDARVVEFFRRLGRTRHSFDPPIGAVPVSALADGTSGTLELSPAVPPAPPPFPVIEGLSGVYTHTPAGGYADLRHRYGASKAGSAFDEFAYTADFRRGRQTTGWDGISKLGVFVWWLQTFAVPPSVPVPYANCTKYKQYSFDPLGREAPLFAAIRRQADAFGEAWVSPDEWQLPGRISQPLFDMRPDKLYPDPAAPDALEDPALAVLEGTTFPYHPMPLNELSINVERGRFHLADKVVPSGNTLHVHYHYGFASDIGAGPYDRRRGQPDLPSPPVTAGGATGDFAAKLAALGATGTVSIGDSLTYTLPADVSGIANLALMSANEQRPVVRALGVARPEWRLNGAAATSTLLIDGLHIFGADIVLTGSFDSVTIRCATLDPGTSGAELATPATYMLAADNQALWPARLIVEGQIKTLTVARAITGAIRTRNGGAIETLSIGDSIVQAIVEDSGGLLKPSDIHDPGELIKSLTSDASALDKFLHGKLPMTLQKELSKAPSPPAAALVKSLSDALNTILKTAIYTAARFAQVRLSAQSQALLKAPSTPATLIALNRSLLADAYPFAFADLALGTDTGDVELSRTTVLGPCAVHRLAASESILDGVTVAADSQHGCVRFCAIAQGSLVHQPYESVTVADSAPLFLTRDFGQPDYARLRDDADAAILTGRDGASILEGAQNGAEMGAFYREGLSLKRRGLNQKCLEYMPVGLVPVWIDAD
jgi:hypothetical protein